jgi:hypothetical protein
MPSTTLTLRPTYPGTPDDYEVIEDGKSIGRIYFSVGVRAGSPPWFWAYYRGGMTKPHSPHDHGYEETLEEAKAAFKKRFEL